MNKIDQLKDELRKLECEPLIKKILEERDRKLKLVGKVFSSHSLSRDVIHKKVETSVYISFIKITGVKYSLSCSLYDEELIYRIEPSRLKEVKVVYMIDCIDITINNDYDGNKIQYKEGNHTKNIRLKYDQPAEVFENLKNKVEESVDSFLNFSTKTLKCPIDFDGHDEIDGNDRVEQLKSLGYKIITLEADEYYYVSSWHPFTYRDFGILVSEDSCTLIENKIKHYQERMSRAKDWSCGGEYLSAYQQTGLERRNIKVLSEILDKIKKEL